MKFGPVQDSLLSWVSRKVRLNSDWAFSFSPSVLNEDCNAAFSWGQYWLSRRKKAAVGSLATPTLQSFPGFSSFKSFPTDFLSIWLRVTIFMYSNCTSQKWKKWFFDGMMSTFTFVVFISWKWHVHTRHAIIKEAIIYTSFIFQFPCNWQYQ